jgi:hypothetical protein
MNADDLPILGMTDEGKLILGGFFTAHDTHGMHCDWFLPMFLSGGFALSVPYFAAECLQHPTRDPDIIWPMLETAYKEAKQPFDAEEQRKRLNYYLAMRWTELGKPSLHDLSLTIMREQRENGKAYLGWVNAVKEALSAAVAVGGETVCGTAEKGSNDGTQRPGSPDVSLATETRKPGSLK